MLLRSTRSSSISAIPHPGNGGDGVVGLAVGLGKDEAALVGIAAPCGQDLVGQLHQALVIRAGQADDSSWASGRCRPPHPQSRGRPSSSRWAPWPWRTRSGRPGSGRGSGCCRPRWAGRRCCPRSSGGTGATKSSSLRKVARSIFMGVCWLLKTMQCSL